MKAIFGYNYAKGDWFVLELVSGVVGDKFCTVDNYYLGYTNHDYTHFFEGEIIDVTLKGGDRYSVTHADGLIFPEVLTLEQSIQNNIKFLKGCKL